MPRVLHIVPDLDYGGLQRLIIDMTSRLERRGFESFVLPLSFAGELSSELSPAARLLTAPDLPPWTMAWPRPLSRLIRSVGPDVVHSHTGVWWKATLAARMARVPRVIHTAHGRHAPDPWHERLLDRMGGALCHRVIAVSDELAFRLTRDLGIPTSKLSVIPGGVDTERFAPRPDDGHMRSELGIAPAVPILGSVGRLEPVKAYDTMIRALSRLSSGSVGGPSPALVIVGDGSEMPRLKRVVSECQLHDRVRLVGWRADVTSWMNGFAVFTLASLSEGTSVSLLEGMSSGLCPVVTNVGGNPAVLGTALHHRMVPPGNPDALAQAWAEALSDPGRRGVDAIAARRRVLDAYGLDAMVDRYASLYEGAA